MLTTERLAWTTAAWEDYQYWQLHDLDRIKRINMLIYATQRDAYNGIGKPQPLIEYLSGSWSRRIDHEHRLIYRIHGTTLLILSCRYQYN